MQKPASNYSWDDRGKDIEVASLGPKRNIFLGFSGGIRIFD